MILAFKDIKYTLVRSRRKTASIYIERDGKVSVLVPEKLTTRQVEDLRCQAYRRRISNSRQHHQDVGG